MYTGAKVIVLLGPPGSGKGTQAERLSNELGIAAVSTGDMLRRECQSGSHLGWAVQTVMASGQLVSDELINQVVTSRLGHRDCENGCILDGYPRTVSQARFLDSLLKASKKTRPVVFDFHVESEIIVSRLSRRRQCSQCGRIFSIDTESKSELLCDRDGAPLIERADDSPAAVRERLRQHARNSGELARYYAAKNYHRICAARAPAEISDELLSLIGFHSHLPALNGRAHATA